MDAKLFRLRSARTTAVLGATAVVVLVTASLISAVTTASASVPSDGQAWRLGVSRVCAHSLLFEGRHSIGTEQGAVAVAEDIRASTARRLVRIERLRAHPAQPDLALRWLQVEHRLAELFASSYLRIWHAIAGANSASQRARLPGILERLVRRPDEARGRARLLEEHLQVPDCTGGDNPAPGPGVAFTPRPSVSAPSAPE